MMHNNALSRHTLIIILLFAALFFIGQTALAQTAPPPFASPMHPVFPLLDGDGQNVLDSGRPVSTMQTCGTCHDTDFISRHSYHADVGLAHFGQSDSGRPWDLSDGLFGRWNPLLYRTLSPVEAERVDLTTPEWLMLLGSRHVGGGPAVYSRNGRFLTDLSPDPTNVESSYRDPDTGELVGWDWQQSGVAEMNCFLCHLPNPNNEARIASLQAGEFGWAATATLLGTGLVEQSGDGWQWNGAAFADDGQLVPDYVGLRGPTNANCGQCHGQVHDDVGTPLVLEPYSLNILQNYSSLTTGQIISPQRLSQGGLNLADKASLNRTWDIHSERLLNCTSCHYSLNNPIYFQGTAERQPDHLLFDPRRIEWHEYLQRPLHQFAKGQSAQSLIAPELDNSLRRCESCHSVAHSVATSHEWLPYKERHTNALSCESCHVPRLHAPALQYVDWTILQPDGEPVVAYRGLDDDLVTGYEPVLLPRPETAVRSAAEPPTLAPFNLVTTWYWVYGDPPQPVPLAELTAVWLDGADYAAEVLALFDEDGNGRLDPHERQIDGEAKAQLIAQRLATLGLENPRIVGEILPFSINHTVTHGDWATKACADCHRSDSRLTRAFPLADRLPGGVTPDLLGSLDLTGFQNLSGLVEFQNNQLTFQPQTRPAGLYILGHDSEPLVNWLGVIIFLGVMLGVGTHGGLRYLVARRRAGQVHEPKLRRVYMYDVYERLWHWLQTAVILLLIFTGLIIHKPDLFGFLSFRFAVEVHNILAAILVINAALSLFYHLVSGEIRQYLPRPRGFFDQTFAQVRYYLWGIFHDEPHPFAKSREQKLNPMQQMTYFAILNVLLPLQIISGILMWGVQRWPDLAARVGGLPFLGPFHTLIAWLFAAFILLHVYLTTTGHTPLGNMRAMIMGWDEVEEP
ncbi:MAG: cytochrome b/b6 domain-containing protein [Chloroflexota bacterium]